MIMEITCVKKHMLKKWIIANKLKIGIVYGGKSAEHEVSLQSNLIC